ncbi:MAG: lauroyl acyltransferase [Alphaproteobacteria bacterium]|nr:lauroyl acyltransferase [Alphaproteobacteria bacterium]
MAIAASTPEVPYEGLPWRYHVEAWLTRLGFGAIRALPLDWASAVGGRLARWIGPRLGVNKRARLNLRAALPELSEAEIDTVVRGMWDNLGRVVFEYPHLPGLTAFGPGGRVEVVGVEHIDRAVAAGRQIILVAGHLGNWEIAPIAAEQYGLSVVHAYRAANNPLVDRMIVGLRPGKITEFVSKGTQASRRLVAALREGKHLGMLADQKMNDGMPVPFFGRDAMTADALARLALRYDCDIIPVRSERLRGAHFRLTVTPVLELPDIKDRQAAIAAVMAAVNARLEEWIRDRPEQWLWVHRRWPD